MRRRAQHLAQGGGVQHGFAPGFQLRGVGVRQARQRPIWQRAKAPVEQALQKLTLTLGEPLLAPLLNAAGHALLDALLHALLHALLQDPGVPLSRSQLEDRLYGWDEEIGSNAVEVHIHALRRKIGSDLVRNVRGVGYMVPRRP